MKDSREKLKNSALKHLVRYADKYLNIEGSGIKDAKMVYEQGGKPYTIQVIIYENE